MSFILDLLRNFIYNVLQVLSFGRKKIKNTLSIYVKTNTGSTLEVELDPNWDIKNVKDIVARKLDLLSDDLKIIFAGKELSDSIVIEECDLGQKSFLHVVKSRRHKHKQATTSKCDLNEVVIEESPPAFEEISKPLCETLVALELKAEERENIAECDRDSKRARFFVYCPQCKKMCTGKLRVRCSKCKGGAFTVHRDPENWDDVLKPRQITGHCESNAVACVDNEEGSLPYTEFYFKCAEHRTAGEMDEAVPLDLIKMNFLKIPCLACTEIEDTVLVFPCAEGHVTCVDCFKQYCTTRLVERQYFSHPTFGYTLGCPANCENSFIEEIHHFKVLLEEQFDRYQRFATEEYILNAGGVLCPQPGCGMGILVDDNCKRITCQGGCGYVFCKDCLQGYHIGDCLPDAAPMESISCGQYTVDPNRANESRWEEASKVTIKVLTKPCPQCRTPTERDGGCMHMVCTRSGCGAEWCWICQAIWTRECMGAHWFG